MVDDNPPNEVEFYQNVLELVKEMTEEDDLKAIAYIERYGNPQLVNYQESYAKKTCLMTAAPCGNVSVVKALLAKGADPNLVTDCGVYSALNYAVLGWKVEMVKTLVEAGAVINNEGDDTHLDTAVAYEFRKVGEYLYSMGGRCARNTYPPEWEKSSAL